MVLHVDAVGSKSSGTNIRALMVYRGDFSIYPGSNVIHLIFLNSSI